MQEKNKRNVFFVRYSESFHRERVKTKETKKKGKTEENGKKR
jgi:hypothetical protein